MSEVMIRVDELYSEKALL